MMTCLTSVKNTPRDRWVEHPQGKLLTRSWYPQNTSDRAPTSCPIILFHDSLGCIDLWRSFPAALCAATARVVISYDRLGFGQSDPRPEPISLDFIADEAKSYFPALADQLGIDRFIAFGHSVGGAMATHCAAAFSSRCEGLITESAQTFAEERTLTSIRLAKQQFNDPQQFARLEKYHGSNTRWVLDAWIESWLHPDFTQWSLEPTLPRVSCPVLAIHGVHDEYGSSRHPETIVRLSSGPARLEIMPNTYHVPHRESEQTVVGLVNSFVTQLSI